MRGGQSRPPLQSRTRTVRNGTASPASHQRGSAALQGPLWEGAVGAADWGREKRVTSLPPSALRADTSLSEGGEERRIPTPVCGLARNDSASRCGAMWASPPTELQEVRANGADRVVRPYKAEQEPCETGRRGRRPLRSDTGGVPYRQKEPPGGGSFLLSSA